MVRLSTLFAVVRFNLVAGGARVWKEVTICFANRGRGGEEGSSWGEIRCRRIR